ncbi:mitochondrial carrier protein Rim2-like [Copidosoma floridanum]|uniref:mitochondrial carrier protein Rim2-like n=1 Tax=Copidosoma floridanum TaxID=29053 RepID=UPI000C6F69F6|nr:mitochondrial carrier protein Rim2-like [Copidosoma floridanum]
MASSKTFLRVAGTVAAIVTCPLEVVKTRLQSSSAGFYPPAVTKEVVSGHTAKRSIPNPQQRRRLCTGEVRRYSLVFSENLTQCAVAPPPGSRPYNVPATPGILQCIRQIVENEGPKALFKGLVPNIIGVAPSRAIYFCTYSQSKHFFNTCLPPDSPVVHMCSASCAESLAESEKALKRHSIPNLTYLLNTEITLTISSGMK